MKREIELYKRLHGLGEKRHTCQQPGCRTITLQDYCQKHRPVVITERNEKAGDPVGVGDVQE